MMQLIKRLLEVKFLGFLAIGYTIFVTIAMLLPVSSNTNINIPFFDKVIHLLIYLVFVLLWLLFFKRSKNQIKGVYLWVSITLFIYGIVIEVLQGSFIASRSQDNWDIIANGTGIIIGVLLFYKIKDRFLFKN